uniref:t-SNARE coiled-coil homology domain-containing protein n=1 Tax=Trichuris muris TaxID=70415 RepID=A0A5S6QGC3_TRIMR
MEGSEANRAWSYQRDASEDHEKDFNRLTHLVSSQIHKISQNVSSIQRMVSQLGTAQDSEQLRQKLHETQHLTHTLSQTTMESLRRLTSLPQPSSLSEQRQWKLQRERLTNDFSVVLNNFQAVQRLAAQKEKASVLRARADSGIEGYPFEDESQEVHAPVPQEKLQIEKNIDIQTIQEREQIIRQLESDIMDVNQIFKDLALLVHEQGEVIDSIEANVDSAQVQIDQGATQIHRAAQYQSKARRKKLYCTLIGLVLLIVISLIIYFSVKGN